MTIRLAVDGREEHRRAFLDRLVARSQGRVEIAFHMGEPVADIFGPDLNRLRPDRNGGLPLHDFRLQGADLPLLAQPAFREMVETAVDQLHRTDPTYRYRSHNIRNLQDYLDTYHILAEALAQKLRDTGATHALFMNVPHVGYDTILYHVAQAMGLHVTVLSQTIFSNQFFSMRRIEDQGRFDPAGSDARPMPIERGSAPDLFYMDARWQKQSPRGRIGARAVASFLRHVALRRPASLLNPGYLARTLRRIADIYGTLPDWRDPFARFFHDNELAYFEHLADFEHADFDLDAPFIYVPLHNQPELSTSALGGIWRDQLLLVEALAAQLPDGWRIYVKENPRQGAFARGPMFFHRLKRIRGVTLLPSAANTHELSARARFTATVSGTAGWEALRKGRPALVFGAAWYRSLPGAVTWQPGLDFEAIARVTFDHADLERAAGALLARCHEGVLETIYTRIVPGYDRDANAERVSETMLGLVEGRIPVTFGEHP
ncbi:MAG: capsular polysaccharide export protein, LipB/KpsS family [Gemmobacter sp.]